ncbi:MAG: response regulator [Chloroflexota bacterium]|nr:response regulator [Chloroflexota bacterium]
MLVKDHAFRDSRILIVDDQEANVVLLKNILKRAGFTNLSISTDSREAVPLYVDERPDLLLLDLMMPYMDGFQVMEQIGPLVGEGSYFPILVLTADITQETKRRALSVGATDFLTKPFDATEVVLRIRNLLQTRQMHLSLENQNQVLDNRVRERTRELEEAQMEILERLAQAAEFRDDMTGQHTRRVGHWSAVLAAELGVMDEVVDLLRRSAPLHDVGKIAIPDSILLKSGRLTPEEFEVMKTHAAVGARLLSKGHSDLVRMAENIALSHHERWDGTGYPRGLAGEAIPVEGRVVSVVDVFDALTHERPYKPAWPVDEAVAEIERQSGYQFDPEVAAALVRLCARGDLEEPTL